MRASAGHLVFAMVLGVVVVADRGHAQQHLFQRREITPQFACTLDPVMHYGIAEPEEGRDYGLTSAQLRSGGPSLAFIQDVAIGPRGRIYALDSGFKKVAVFREDGGIDAVILGGDGEGPGEFRSPFSVTVTQQGAVLVSDTELRRITVFSVDGLVNATIPVPQLSPDEIEVDGKGRIWALSQIPSGDEPSAIIVSETGSVVARRFPPGNERTKLYRQSGEPGDLFRVGDEVWYATGQPGTWWRHETALDGPFGNEPFPNLEPTRLNNGARHARMGTREASQLGPGRVGILYFQREIEDGKPLEMYHFLDVFKINGEYERTCIIPYDGKISGFAASLDGTYIYVPEHQPYPRVTKYRLRFPPLPGGLQ